VEKQGGKKKGKLLEFEHNLQHMKAAGGLKVGLKRNRHRRKKGMGFKELKTPLHHMKRGVISMSKFKRGKQKVDWWKG